MAGSRDDNSCFVGYLYAAVSILEPHIAAVAGIIGLVAILGTSSGVCRNKCQIMRMRHGLVVSADIAYVIIAVFMLSLVLLAVAALAFMPMLVFVLAPIVRQVVAQRIAGEEGRLIRRALGAQTADCAGLVIDCLFGTGCNRLQILCLCFFSREAVCRHLAVFAAADRADSLGGAGRCAAVAILGFRMAGVTLTDSGVGLFIAVLRPSTPVVVQRGIRCDKRISVVGAYFSARTG